MQTDRETTDHIQNNARPSADDILAVARSYYDRREDLVYSVKGNTFLSGGELIDREHGGKGRIDCSTYIHLILQGIPYQRSPYASGDVQDFYSSAAKWAARDIAAMFREGQPIRKAHQLAKYYWELGLARTDDRWKSGDILFFQVPPEKVAFYLSFNIFQAVYHIGIAAEDRDEMYESSGNQTVNVESNYMKPGISISRILDRRPPLFYVRLTE